MKAAIVICFISIIGLIIGVNLMNRSGDSPVVEETAQTADVPH